MTWLKQHPEYIIPIISLILGTVARVLKILFRARTSEELSALKQASPRIAAAIVILGAGGIEIASFFEGLASLLRGFWPASGAVAARQSGGGPGGASSAEHVEPVATVEVHHD